MVLVIMVVVVVVVVVVVGTVVRQGILHQTSFMDPELHGEISKADGLPCKIIATNWFYWFPGFHWSDG